MSDESGPVWIVCRPVRKGPVGVRSQIKRCHRCEQPVFLAHRQIAFQPWEHRDRVKRLVCEDCVADHPEARRKLAEAVARLLGRSEN